MENAAFASMRVRMWERDLLSESTLDRMMESPDPEAFHSLLQETRYGKWMKSREGLELEEILTKELQAQAAALSELVQEPKLLRLLFLPYDVHNLKVAVKASTDPKRFEGLFLPFGTLDLEQVKKKIASPRASESLTEQDRALHEAARIWQETQNAQQVDLRLDEYYYEQMRQLTKGKDLSFYREIAQDLTDFTNVLTFFRTFRQNRPKHFVAEAFLPGGKLAFEELWKATGVSRNHVDGSLDATMIRKVMRGKNLSDSLLRATDRYLSDGDITTLEKAKDRFLLEKAEEAKRVPEGAEVLFSYLERVQTEIQNLQIILSGKRVGLAPDKIREHVRSLKGETETERAHHA